MPKIYHYPCLPGDLVFPIRVQSIGLCNLLLPTLRAYINASLHNHIFVRPCFRQLDIKSALLLRQPRFYSHTMSHRGMSDVLNLLCSAVAKEKVSEDIFQLKEDLYLTKDSVCVYYKGLNNYYHSLDNMQHLVKDFFIKFLPPRTRSLFYLEPCCDIAIHIRGGDFLRRDPQKNRGMNTLLPIEWYGRAFKYAKSLINIGNPRVRIYTDSPNNYELFKRFTDTKLDYCSSSHPVEDLVQMSRSKVLIASRSSFSMMARQMGDSLCIWDQHFNYSQFFRSSSRDFFV